MTTAPDTATTVVQEFWRLMATNDFHTVAAVLSPEEFSFLRANYGKRAMEWPQLMADVRDAIDEGATPDSPQARELALRWMDLFRSYAGDDPATHAKFRQALQTEPELTKGSWADEALFGFMREAMRRIA
jgi:MerR family transcriptional regulator, thiopeptide resistance regulator